MKRGTISLNSEDVPFLDEDEQQQVINDLREARAKLNRKYTSIFSMISLGFLLVLVYLFFVDVELEEVAEDELENFQKFARRPTFERLVDGSSYPSVSKINIALIFVATFASLVCGLVGLHMTTKLGRNVCFFVGMIPNTVLYCSSYFVLGTSVRFHILPIFFTVVLYLVAGIFEDTDEQFKTLEKSKYKHKKA